jgi:hypothetical protein
MSYPNFRNRVIKVDKCCNESIRLLGVSDLLEELSGKSNRVIGQVHVTLRDKLRDNDSSLVQKCVSILSQRVEPLILKVCKDHRKYILWLGSEVSILIDRLFT